MGNENDEAQILALHEAGDRALMNADLAVLERIFADDYVQYNEAGKAFTKQDVLEQFSTAARFVIRRLFRPGAKFASSATRRSCMDRNPMKSKPAESASPCATFIWTYCGNATASGSWWRRS